MKIEVRCFIITTPFSPGKMKKLFRTHSILFLYPLLLVLSGCSLLKTEIRTEITIEAPLAIVWDVLADFNHYPQWNPYHVKVLFLEEPADGQPSENPAPYRLIRKGEKLHVYIHKPNGKKLDLKVKVRELVTRHRLYWGGGIPGIFAGEHRFILEELSATSTLLRHDEDFQGLALPFVPLEPEYIEQGYRLMNQKAKERAEAVYREAF
jgi:hypothetical protein